MSINPCNLHGLRVETIKWQTRVAVVVWQEGCKPMCAGLAYSL